MTLHFFSNQNDTLCDFPDPHKLKPGVVEHACNTSTQEQKEEDCIGVLGHACYIVRSCLKKIGLKLYTIYLIYISLVYFSNFLLLKPGSFILGKIHVQADAVFACQQQYC